MLHFFMIIINSLHAKFFKSINMYLLSISVLHIDLAQVIEILPHVRQDSTYAT